MPLDDVSGFVAVEMWAQHDLAVYVGETGGLLDLPVRVDRVSLALVHNSAFDLGFVSGLSFMSFERVLLSPTAISDQARALGLGWRGPLSCTDQPTLTW